jgi:hypothetical protein
MNERTSSPLLLTSLDPTDSGAADSAAAITIGAQSMSRAHLFDAACALAGCLPDDRWWSLFGECELRNLCDAAAEEVGTPGQVT